MTDKEQKEIFSKNLNRLLSQNEKTQREVAFSINVSPQTFNTWVQGIALPRMGKVQRLADYFHVKKSDLIDPPIDLSISEGLFTSSMSSDVEKLLTNYNLLNDTGKQEARKRVQELTEIERYKKGASASSAEMAG